MRVQQGIVAGLYSPSQLMVGHVVNITFCYGVQR